jgi:glycosyltransferase involved in cell wall biosynthesis
LYSGSIGTWYMLDEMLDFYKEVITLYPEAYFLILTSDDAEIILKKAKEKFIDSEKIKIGFFRRDEMPSVVSVSDISIFFIRPTFSKIASSPTKLGELYALGIPVVCNGGVGDLDFIVKEVGGVIINDFSVVEYKKAIQKIAEANYSKTALREKAKPFYDLRYAIDTYALAYKQIFK